MKSEQANSIATQALIWLSSDSELMEIFLNASGLAPEDIRTRAQDPVFLGFLLDFMLMSDEHVLALSAAGSFPPESVVAARAALPGGDIPNWT